MNFAKTLCESSGNKAVNPDMIRLPSNEQIKAAIQREEKLNDENEK